MAGRFRGLSEAQWWLFQDLFEGYEHWDRKPGRRPTPLRFVVNSLLYVLHSGCKWDEIPKGKIWASKSAAHRFAMEWEKSGLMKLLKERVLALAQKKMLIDWDNGAVDGSFSPWERRRRRRRTRLQRQRCDDTLHRRRQRNAAKRKANRGKRRRAKTGYTSA